MRWPSLHAHYYPRACYWYALRIGGNLLIARRKKGETLPGKHAAYLYARIGWRLWTLSVTVPA